MERWRTALVWCCVSSCRTGTGREFRRGLLWPELLDLVPCLHGWGSHCMEQTVNEITVSEQFCFLKSENTLTTLWISFLRFFFYILSLYLKRYKKIKTEEFTWSLKIKIYQSKMRLWDTTEALEPQRLTNITITIILSSFFLLDKIQDFWYV